LVTKITIAVVAPICLKNSSKNILILLSYHIDILTFLILSTKNRHKRIHEKNLSKNPIKNRPKFFSKNQPLKVGVGSSNIVLAYDTFFRPKPAKTASGNFYYQ